MSRSSPRISVVVPLHNEAANVALLCEAIHSALTPLARPYEIVLVNDGSTDDTGARLELLARLDARVRPVHLDANY
ncbi:MAG: glycosyltransferase, partial [Actinomycetota bacterium]